MTQSSWPFGGVNTTEAQYTKLFKHLQDTGVSDPLTGTNLKVLGDGTGLNVKVQAGFAVVRGHAYESDAEVTLPIAAPGGSLKYHYVVLRLDPTANTIVLATVGGGTSLPSLTQTSTGNYEYPLALVSVPAGATSISAAMITDMRQSLGSRVQSWAAAGGRPLAPLPHQQLGYNAALGYYELWDGSGWVPLADKAGPAEPMTPYVRLQRTSSSSAFFAGSGAQVNFSTVAVTRGSIYSNVSPGSATIAIPGLYLVDFTYNHIDMDGGNEHIGTIRINGSTEKQASMPNTGGNDMGGVSLMCELAEDDVVSAFFRTNGSGYALLGSKTSLKVRLLEAF